MRHQFPMAVMMCVVSLFIDGVHADVAKEYIFLSALEKQVVEETNLARTNPAQYAKLLAETRKFYSGNLVKIPGRITLRTSEGLAAVDEAIAYLESAKPLGALTPSKGMSLGAREHVKDTGPKGAVGHTGTDGSQPWERINRFGSWGTSVGENISYGHNEARAIVMQLIVDDGVSSRGHRKNIFTPDFKMVGIACGAHKRYSHMCVQVFAGSYTEKY